MYRWCKCYLLWEKNYLLGKKLRTSVLWKPIYTGNVLAHCIANFETPLMTSPIVYAFSSHGLYIPVDTDGNTRHLRATRQTIGTLNSGVLALVKSLVKFFVNLAFWLGLVCSVFACCVYFGNCFLICLDECFMVLPHSKYGYLLL